MTLAREPSTQRTAPDPLARARRLTRRTHIAAAACIAIAAVWALLPVASPQITVPDLSTPVELFAKPETRTLNLAAFDSALWTAPPKLPADAVAAAPSPPPPLKLQLLGIVGEPADGMTIYRAALYDPDTDRILVVASGDSIAGRTVASVDRDAVSLTLGPSTQTLSLRTDQATSKGSRR